ncbi:MAG: hypothetical protein OEL83_11110 [Desulforhopalus sp.]|nr:hypothetical protein [Desulforhopalus sp.]
MTIWFSQNYSRWKLIVHRIVELHGGSIEVKSSDGWTTFSIILPSESEALLKRV